MRAIAIDWSGRAARESAAIWLAEAVDGRLIDLQGGFTRREVIDEAVRRPADLVGLDFAFSFPRWWCEENRWHSARAVWAAASDHGETWLADCAFPFWGRPQKRNGHEAARLFRRTERETTNGRPKSVFQIGGAGAVGTGSIRGMPYLLDLARAGFAIWPFDGPAERNVVEIYPREFTGPVNKRSERSRREHLAESCNDQDPELLERAAGSEDAFDAAVSAIAMSRHKRNLEPAADPDYRIEGRIWLG